MSNLEIIASLCNMLDEALEIIKVQAEILTAHGIETYSGRLEEQRQKLLEKAEGGWGDSPEREEVKVWEKSRRRR